MQNQNSSIAPNDSKNARYLSYLTELKSLDPSDPDLSHKINEISKHHMIDSGDRFNESNLPGRTNVCNNKFQDNPLVQFQSFPQFSSFPVFPVTPFFSIMEHPFRSFDRRINSVFNNFDTQFNQINTNQTNSREWDKLEKELPIDELNEPYGHCESNESNESNESKNLSKHKTGAYCKYTSSFTSFDKDGNKKSKSISGVEKVVNGKRFVSKTKKTIDGDDVTEEQYFPDGRSVVTKSKTTQKTIEN